VAAIDQAVKDGVDVINFSISGAVTTSVDPVEIAFLYAADAGVFVATSAGNRGPGESTVAHPSPWLTTVAATTHTVNESTLVLGNGERYVGASVTGGIGATPMVLAEASVLAGQDPEEAALCFPGTLDPAAVAGQMVVCDRGVNDRAEKSRVVEAAGGVAMVLANVTPGSLNGDLHAVPSVHVDEVAGAEIKDYVATEAAPTGEILAGVSTGTTTPPPPAIAGFSSRGPSLAADGDLLKPDIAAPGVDVLAAVAPEGNSDRNWDFYSGTSMSSPHIAGLAALIAQRNPTWSPMTIKSAMMTTAGNLNDSRDPFLQGAGFVQPNSFMNPGLAFDSDFDDWEDFLSGQGLPLSDNPVSASNFNTASVAINDMAGTETVTREVTNVSNRASTYTFSKTRYRGFKVSASPSTFRIAPGESQRIGLSFARTVAPLDQYAKGNLFLKDDRGHTVRFPAVVKPVALAAPPEVPTADEAFSFEVKSGVSGTIKAGRWGLVPGVDTEATAQDTSAAAFDPEDERNYTQNMFVGGPNVTVRVQLDGDFDPGDDLDLFMVAPDGETVVAASAAGGSEEIVTLTGLERGRYTAHVQAWAIDGAATSKEFIVRTFKVPPKTVANWTVTPVTQEVRPGQFVTYTVRTDGLQAGTPYLGAIVYRQVEGADEGRPIIGRTLVSIG